MNKKFYITTAIPYVNAKPHVGHALEFVQADVVARYHRLIGDDTILLSGSDENALKNVQAAENEGLPVQEFIDKNSKLFEELEKNLNIDIDIFQKGSSNQHIESSQKLWELCAESGDIYKKSYTGLYCVGCEQFYEADELDENGQCFEHPGKKLEEVSEENYFFRLSKYGDAILNILEGNDPNNSLSITPQYRTNEMISFVKSGLKDISISRSNERAKNWGVPVPGDDSQRMYVWFDALNIYQSGIGFGWDEQKYKKYWPADTHVIGKGILRFHAIYWLAFLLSAGLLLPKRIFVHGYFTVDGQKMSKTIGNVIDPNMLIEKYGADALRYYFLTQISPTEDGDFSEEKLTHVYNSDLANGLGNLVARVAKLCEKVSLSGTTPLALSTNMRTFLDAFEFNNALDNIWLRIRQVDQYLNEKEPWKLNDSQELKSVLEYSRDFIVQIATDLQPFLPETSEKILSQFTDKTIKSTTSLFPRIEG